VTTRREEKETQNQEGERPFGPRSERRERKAVQAEISEKTTSKNTKKKADRGSDFVLKHQKSKKKEGQRNLKRQPLRKRRVPSNKENG